MSINPLTRRENTSPSAHRVRVDVLIGVGLLALVVAVKLVGALSDGSILSALGAR